MSTTLEKIDAREYLLNWLKGLTAMYCADVNATPEDKWTETFGGCTRNLAAISADAISLLEWTTLAMKGQTPAMDGYEAYMKALIAECGTPAGTCAKLQSAADAFSEELANASEETLTSIVRAPWGMDTPLFMIAQAAVSHLWYHDGQLNYVQRLLGDSKIHWMG